LVKPNASGGGRLIEPLLPESFDFPEPCYYQRFIEGPSFSAVFVAARGRACLLGASRQLHGGCTGRFAYRGNIGPITMSDRLASRLRRLGDVLASGFGLIGLFGVDYILRRGEPWLLEVNPRYTASVEVLELGLGRSILQDHIEACAAVLSPVTRPRSCRDHDRPNRVVGKEIIYAERALLTPEIAPPAYSDEDPFAIPGVADVPWPGTSISRGEPIMTVLTEGPDELTCLARLHEQTSRWRDAIEKCGNTHNREPAPD
jgi:predicted ATP-grasp superfamily ATP-dependent carboligase